MRPLVSRLLEHHEVRGGRYDVAIQRSQGLRILGSGLRHQRLIVDSYMRKRPCLIPLTLKLLLPQIAVQIVDEVTLHVLEEEDTRDSRTEQPKQLLGESRHIQQIRANGSQVVPLGLLNIESRAGFGESGRHIVDERAGIVLEIPFVIMTDPCTALLGADDVHAAEQRDDDSVGRRRQDLADLQQSDEQSVGLEERIGRIVAREPRDPLRQADRRVQSTGFECVVASSFSS